MVNQPHFRIDENEDGKELSSFSIWKDEITEVATRCAVTSIHYLPTLRKGETIDMSFLANFPYLQQFSLLALSELEIVNFDFIYNLKQLRKINISSRKSTGIDFTKFSELENVIFFWHKNSQIEKCLNIRSLQLHHYQGVNLTEFSALSNLTELSLFGCKIRSLAGVECFSQLTELFLADNRQLESLEGIGRLKYLTRFLVDGGCKKLETITELGNVISLSKIMLDDLGEIQSLAPLSVLKNLQELDFIGSTRIIDGDLSVLDKLPNLRRVLFVDRKHYSHKNDYFEKKFDKGV